MGSKMLMAGVGIAAGTLLGATAALALTGDLNAKGMRKIGKNVQKSASKVRIEM